MQVVVVSGGSSGIGLECVKKFLQHDYIVYNLDIIKHELSAKNYTYLETDVTNHNNIKQSIDFIIQKNVNIDILVCSAGCHLSANIEQTTDKALIELFELNVLGTFKLIQTITPYMKNNNFGKIITIGSDQSTIAKHNSTVYGMTKAAILSLTKSIALDYAKYNIQANCIGAGTIDTPLYRQAINNYANKTGIDIAKLELDEARAQPVNRIGMPDEIAELAFFLSQQYSSFITGALIPIDGGYTAI